MISSFFSSLLFFTKLFFVKKHYDVIFYSPQHFNRSKNHTNEYFSHLIDSCKKNNLSYIYFEEPSLKFQFKRCPHSIPFDFLYYLIIFLRKFMGSEMSYHYKDIKIGRFLKLLFFRRITFDNYITISQSMLSFFNGLCIDAKKFDMQHGTIHSQKDSYLKDGIVSTNLIKNQVHLLLFGNGFQDLLISNDTQKYFISHSHVIGYFTNFYNQNHVNVNRDVLVSLQFTDDHSLNENQNILDLLFDRISNETKFNFFLLNHPRFTTKIDLSSLLQLPNVFLSNNSLIDSLDKCSLHLTVYSTTTFEASIMGIPTSFIKINSLKMNIFDKQYNYPFYNSSLEDLYNNYITCSSKVKEWADNFYCIYSEKNFLKVLKNGSKKN